MSLDAAAITIHVSPSGNANGDGSLATPVGSVSQAYAMAVLSGGFVKISIAPGTFGESNTLTLDNPNSVLVGSGPDVTEFTTPILVATNCAIESLALQGDVSTADGARGYLFNVRLPAATCTTNCSGVWREDTMSADEMRIRHLAEPEQAGDAVTLAYAQGLTNSLMVVSDNRYYKVGSPISGSLVFSDTGESNTLDNMSLQQVGSVAILWYPAGGSFVVKERYSGGGGDRFIVQDGEISAKRMLDMNGNWVVNVADPIGGSDVATRRYVDAQDDDIRSHDSAMIISNTAALFSHPFFSSCSPAAAAYADGADWSDADGCLQSNDDSAAGIYNNYTYSSMLCATGFSFNIPDCATILGIEVRTISGVQADDAWYVVTERLVNDGAEISHDYNHCFTGGTGTNDNVVGSSEDTWDVAPTPQMVNLPGFGIGMYLMANAKTVLVDYVEMTVHYSITLTNFVSKSGDAMSGPLYLSGDPTEDFQAASKGYVDSSINSIAVGVSSVGADAPLSSSGGSTPTISIDDNAIGTAKIADGAITSNKLASNVNALYVGKAGDTMTGTLSVPALKVTGADDWHVGTEEAPVNIVMMNEDGVIQSVYDLNFQAGSGGSMIQFKSPVKFEGGIEGAFVAGRTNDVVTSDSGCTVSVPSCTPSSTVLITPASSTVPWPYWVECTNGSFTVKSTGNSAWSFNYLVR